jgi:phosphate transport system permease protein
MPDQPSRHPIDETGMARQNQPTAGNGAPRQGESTLLSEQIMQPPSLTQRSRRIGERLIELGIFAIATLSIIFIFLIFFFIFREASPIFFGAGTEKSEAVAQPNFDLPPGLDTVARNAPAGTDTANSSDTGDIIAYNSVHDIPQPGAAEEANKNRTKDSASSAAARDTGDMEVYNPDVKDLPATPAKSAAQTKREQDSITRAIVGNDYPILTRDSPIKLSYLLHNKWEPNSEHPRYGIYPIILGTLKTTLVALLIATPLSILAALYTAFFAPKRLREILKPIIEILAGFPSVVIGFFCLMTVASIVQGALGTTYRLNAVVGGIGLALAVIPIIYTITDDALRAVPMSLREAALAIGASEWQAAYQVMLPAATPGIFAAILLGLGRAFGETMIALMATGNAGTSNWNFFEPVRTFAATIGAEMGEVVFGAPHYQLLFLLGVILFIFSFGINFVTEFYIKQRLIKKFRGVE